MTEDVILGGAAVLEASIYLCKAVPRTLHCCYFIFEDISVLLIATLRAPVLYKLSHQLHLPTFTQLVSSKARIQTQAS